MYTQLYKITSKYYFKTYVNGTDDARTRTVCVSDALKLSQAGSYIYYIYDDYDDFYLNTNIMKKVL